MHRSMKMIPVIILASIAVLIVGYILGVGMFHILGIDRYGTYFELEQSDVRHYGQYVGNKDNQMPAKFIRSFFPDAIEPFFSDPIYHYKAQRPGVYACEAWLEFTIEDAQCFDAYYNSLKQYGSPQVFPYDNHYEVWTISNEIRLYEHEEYRNETELSISYSRIGFILCNRETNQFIYAAHLVANGGTTPVKDLNYLFDRLSIDPLEYAQRSE